MWYDTIGYSPVYSGHARRKVNKNDFSRVKFVHKLYLESL